MIQHDELSFLPDEYLRGKRRRKIMRKGAAVAAMVVAVMGTAAVRAERQLRAVEARHSSVACEYDQASETFDRLWKQHQDNRTVARRAAMAANLIERVPRSNLLAELTNRLPEGASLMEINLESRPRQQETSAAPTTFDMKKAALQARRSAEEDPLPQKPEAEIAIKISGLAETDVQVAHYLSALGRSPLFREVSLVVSEAYAVPHGKGPMLRRFQMQMIVARRAELQPRSGDITTKTAAAD